jgi:RNA polymerase sigma factor (sigma-70 family)
VNPEADGARPMPGTEPMATQTEAAHDLGAEISRGQRLDSELARDLGRREPTRSTTAGEYVDALHRRARRSQREERQLVMAAKNGDASARARLVEAFMPLIATAARTYRSAHVQHLELLQEGIVGLLRALERYDPARGVPFWGYATWWVRQAMQQLVAELTRPVVLSDRALRHLARLKQAHRDALRERGREPGRDELAARAGLSLEQVDELLATERDRWRSASTAPMRTSAPSANWWSTRLPRTSTNRCSTRSSSSSCTRWWPG